MIRNNGNAFNERTAYAYDVDTLPSLNANDNISAHLRPCSLNLSVTYYVSLENLDKIHLRLRFITSFIS